MNETINLGHPKPCPAGCPCPVISDIAASIARSEDALACLLNAECNKIGSVLSVSSDYEVLIAIDNSVQETLTRITTLEGVLKAKLDSIIPLLTECM